MPDADCHLITRPLTGQDGECGDTGVVKRFGEETFLSLVDALGHGRSAHQVASLAHEYLESHSRQGLVELLDGLHLLLRGTGGAVAACCRLTLTTGQLLYAGMGNVTVRVLGPRAARLVSREGILGYSISSPRQEMATLLPGDVLVMHSDGLQEHFDSRECEAYLAETAEAIAENLMRRYGKETDDAACLVLRYLG